MPNCSICSIVKKKQLFSSAQLKKSASVRKCKQCSFDAFSIDKFKTQKKDLFHWLKNNQSNANNVSLSIENNIRCLYAGKRLKKNDEILHIHNSCLISATKAINSPSGELLQEIFELDNNNQSQDSHNFIAIFLLEERLKNKDSFFSPYLAMLPSFTDYKTSMPVFFNTIPDEFTNSFYLGMLQAKQIALKKEYELIESKCPDLMSYHTLEDFKWARTAVITRVFGCTVEKNKSEEFLVPIADMMNHTHEVSCDWFYDIERESFVMNCAKNTLKSVQLFDSYGAKCNSRYFINYGFTLDNNQNFNQAAIFMPKIIKDNDLLSQFDPYIGMCISYDDGHCGYNENLDGKTRESVLRFQVSNINIKIQHGQSTGKRSVLQCILSMFSFARMMACETKEEVDTVVTYLEQKKQELMSDDSKLPPQQLVEFFKYPLTWYNIPIVSFQHEKRALEFIQLFCKYRLEEFTTTLEEDIAFRNRDCKQYTLPYNLQNMLISEKEVLHYYIDLFNFVNDNSFKDIRRSEKFKPYYKLFCVDQNNFLSI